MTQRYISTDVEYSGESDTQKGQGSLLSLGSCIVGDINEAFYAELQPINRIYNERAMQVIAPGFVGLGDLNGLVGGQILDLLQEKGMTPKDFISLYTLWLEEKGNITELATPIKFDGGLTGFYFREYGRINPLGFSGADGKSMLQGFFADTKLNFKKILGNYELPHNALRDAQIQAVEFEMLLKMMDDVKAGADYNQRYLRGGEEFQASPEVGKILTWTRDTIHSIKNTPFGDKVLSYKSIL